MTTRPDEAAVIPATEMKKRCRGLVEDLEARERQKEADNQLLKDVTRNAVSERRRRLNRQLHAVIEIENRVGEHC